MSTVHVVGPVIRSTASTSGPYSAAQALTDQWILSTYKVISSEASEFNATANLPHADHVLEQADATRFCSQMIANIEASNLVVTVFTHGDVSAGIEAATASHLKKKQLIVTRKSSSLPRMLRGLPGVNVASIDDMESLKSELRSFLGENLRGYRAMTR